MGVFDKFSNIFRRKDTKKDKLEKINSRRIRRIIKDSNVHFIQLFKKPVLIGYIYQEGKFRAKAVKRLDNIEGKCAYLMTTILHDKTVPNELI